VNVGELDFQIIGGLTAIRLIFRVPFLAKGWFARVKGYQKLLWFLDLQNLHQHVDEPVYGVRGNPWMWKDAG